MTPLAEAVTKYQLVMPLPVDRDRKTAVLKRTDVDMVTGSSNPHQAPTKLTRSPISDDFAKHRVAR